MASIWLPAETKIEVTLEANDVVEVKDTLQMSLRPVAEQLPGFAAAPLPPAVVSHHYVSKPF